MKLSDRKQRWLTPLVLTIVLIGIGVETSLRPTKADAEPYHRKALQLAARAPAHIGPWRGEDQTIAESDRQLLNPNVILQRWYTRPDRPGGVGFLLVQCKDARDIYGHYPRNCYPSHGWKLDELASRPVDAEVDGLTIRGIEYVFHKGTLTDQALERVLFVWSFIVVPASSDDQAGRIDRDMEAVKGRAWDYRRRHFGAAQVQVVFTNPNESRRQRQAVFETMVRAHRPLIEWIRDGGGASAEAGASHG